MRRMGVSALALVLALLFAVGGWTPRAWAIEAPGESYSQTYVMMDSETGQALFGKDMHQKMYPASITKVMTVALVMQDHQMNEPITITETMVEGIDQDASHIALSPGEEVTVEEMIYATMLPSANDAANALAEYDAGSIDAFVEKMNEKAQELGAVNTNFVNPNGLHDDNHYTTAYDFALITRWALTVEGFSEVFGAAEYDMEATNLNEARHFGTDDCLTVTSDYTYEGAIGGKLGWTNQAQHTYVSAAQRDGLTLIFVGLSSPTQWDKFEDAVAMYDYAFENYQETSLATQGFEIPALIPIGATDVATENVVLEIPAALTALIPVDDDGSALTIQHNIPQVYAGTSEMDPALSVYNGEDLLYTVSIPYSIEPIAVSTQGDAQAGEGRDLWSALKLILIVLLVLVLLFVAFFLFLCVLRYRNLARRRRARRR